MATGAIKKSKSALFLIELIIAIMFFALSSAICVQLFAKAHLISQKSSDTTMAVLQAQTVAEQWRTTGGGPDTPVYYDADWKDTTSLDSAVYRLVLMRAPAEENGMVCANIEVWRVGAAQPLFTLRTGAYKGNR